MNILFLIQICEKQKQGGWTIVWDTQQQVPYSYNGLQWVGYENAQSVKVKADYAIANNLAGVMIWSIEDEDHKNVCGGGVYPLMNAIKNALKSVNIKLITIKAIIEFPSSVVNEYNTAYTTHTGHIDHS